MERYRGFTLIELLVVILIMSILLGVATLSSVSGAARNLSAEAERLKMLFSYAQAEAVSSGAPLGFSIVSEVAESSNSPVYYYHWARWTREEEVWQLITDGALKIARAPDSMIAISTYARDIESAGTEDDFMPEVLFLPDSTLTPFNLQLIFTYDDKARVTLFSDGFNPVEYKLTDESV